MTFNPAVCAGFLLALGILVGPTISGGEQAEGLAHGPLDGMVFAGKIGAVENPDLDDALYFQDGHFWSAACTRCGFAPGPYWVRNVNDGIEFRGTLESPDRGTFSYLGFVRDGRISVAINWRHDRWYWSIDRDLRFEGTLADSTAAGMTLRAARAAAMTDPENPDDCPS